MPRRPLELLNLAVVVILAVLALAAGLLGRLPQWPEVLLRDALLALFVLIMAWLAQREEKLPLGLKLAVNFYPMALIPLIYESLGTLIPAIHPVERDAWLIAADRALFHVDPTVWLEKLIWPPATDLFYLAYCTYYFFPIIVGILLWRHNKALCRKFIFGLSLAFFVSYTGYFIIPARGPRVALASVQTVAVDNTPLAHAISTTLDKFEHTRDDAFPSGHTMITVFCLLVAYFHEKKLFRIWLPIAVLLVLATVYCRFHYVTDVLAGLALAFAVLPLGNRLYDWIAGEAALVEEAATPPAP